VSSEEGKASATPPPNEDVKVSGKSSGVGQVSAVNLLAKFRFRPRPNRLFIYGAPGNSRQEGKWGQWISFVRSFLALIASGDVIFPTLLAPITRSDALKVKA